MSTYFFLFMQLLADNGVPVTWFVHLHPDDVPATVHSAHSARGGASQARSAPSTLEKAPREFDRTSEISNGF
jgi:hypothetical protein